MLGFGNTRLGRAVVTARAACDRELDVCDRYAAGLYRQALLTLNDADVAEQSVCDVSVSERRQGPHQRAMETMRIILWRWQPASVAQSWATGRNGTTAHLRSDCPPALRAARELPQFSAETSGKRPALSCSAASGAARSGVSRRSLCQNGSSFASGTAQAGNLSRFLCPARHSSCRSGQPARARATASARRIAGQAVLEATATHRACAIAPATGMTREGTLVMPASTPTTGVALAGPRG